MYYEMMMERKDMNDIETLCNRLDKLMEIVPELRLPLLSMKNDETGLRKCYLKKYQNMILQ